jgi:hypothetical protein
MTDAVRFIADGRVGLRTIGKAEEGRIYFAQGLQEATMVFTEVKASRDPNLMLFAEYTYTAQELASSRPDEKEARASCEAAMQDFDDAFLALKAVNDHAGYQIANMTYPSRPKFRYKGMPRDAFHLAYMGHRTRVHNTLRNIGFDPAEQSLLELRMTVFNTAQDVYLEKQQAALSSIAV